MNLGKNGYNYQSFQAARASFATPSNQIVNRNKSNITPFKKIFNFLTNTAFKLNTIAVTTILNLAIIVSSAFFPPLLPAATACIFALPILAASFLYIAGKKPDDETMENPHKDQYDQDDSQDYNQPSIQNKNNGNNEFLRKTPMQEHLISMMKQTLTTPQIVTHIGAKTKLKITGMSLKIALQTTIKNQKIPKTTKI